MKSVVLIDDHHLVRAGLRSLIEDLENYQVLSEGSDGIEALPLLKKYNPDILILDIDMPKKSGIEVLPEIHKNFPTLPVILLSMHASRVYLEKAFESGAQAYLLKDSAEVELELALKAVGCGERYVSPKLSDKFIEALTQPSATKQNTETALTKRQKQILTMLADGKTTKEIAFELHLSAKTVEAHRAQIMERLNIRDFATLVRYAIRTKLVALDNV